MGLDRLVRALLPVISQCQSLTTLTCVLCVRVCAGGMGGKGTGVRKDMAQAAAWYRKAADAGSTAAMVNLGVCYVQGAGVSEDAAEASRWFAKAAELGDAVGMVRLAYRHLDGSGVPKDTAAAVALARRAVAVGGSSGDDAKQHRITLAQCLMADRQYAEALALLEPEEATATPEDHVFCKLGELHYHGLAVPTDVARAVVFFRRAGRSCCSALLGLAMCHEFGEGVAAPDLAEAERLYRDAAAEGSKAASARCIEFGWTASGSPDPAAAVALYETQATAKDDGDAAFFLGRRYELGWPGTAPDLEAARRWYTKAANDSSRNAREALARLGA